MRAWATGIWAAALILQFAIVPANAGPTLLFEPSTGKILYAEDVDDLWHPASLTKIMTLYLLFEQIEAGNLRLDSRLEVSEHAAEQAPSKLGLMPGQTPRGGRRDPRAGDEVGERRGGGRGRGDRRR